MMKPKAQNPNETGLLEYLEDIIGTDKYVEPIEEHYKQLEQVSESRQGMVARVKLVERERDALEDDKLLAESYLSKQRDMHVHKAKVAKLYMHAGQVCNWGGALGGVARGVVVVCVCVARGVVVRMMACDKGCCKGSCLCIVCCYSHTHMHMHMHTTAAPLPPLASGKHCYHRHQHCKAQRKAAV